MAVRRQAALIYSTREENLRTGELAGVGKRQKRGVNQADGFKKKIMMGYSL